MVIRLACLCMLVVVVSCTSDKTTPEEIASSETHIIASDTSSAVTVAPADARIDTLVLHYTAGEVYHYRVRQTSSGGPDTAKMLSFSQHGYTKRIKSKRADGNFEIGVTFDSISAGFSIKNMISGEVLREDGFKSSDTAALKDPRNLSYTAVLGVEVTMIVTPKGKVQEIIGASTIVNRMIPKGQEMPPEQKARMQEQVETAMFGAFSEQEYLRFPDNVLDTSASWSTSTSTVLGDLFTVESTNTYKINTVKKVKGLRIAEVGATVVGAIKARIIPPEYRVSVKVKKSSITGTGKTVIDLDKGYTITKSNEVHMDVDALITKSDGKTEKGAQQTTIKYDVELLR
ncbi:MAG: DUF6263 family protein [bacterium]|nr:DUF6263 family protein [bacterium]